MRTAVCLYVRNEERDLPEWLAYYAALGVDAFIVYENMSDDGTWAVLERARKVWDVRPRRWSAAHRFSHMLAYNHCLLTEGTAFDWVGFFDADEFFVPVRDGDVKRFLSGFGHASAVALNFAFYGSCGHDDFPDGLVTEAFTRRAPDDFDPNRLSKSFVRPWRRVCKSTHYFPGVGAYVGADGAPIAWAEHPGRAVGVSLHVARVNHYFTRSRAHWRSKLARGYRDISRMEDEFYYYDRNDVEDLAAARLSDRVKAELARYAAA